MFKSILLAGAALVSVPALAQEVPAKAGDMPSAPVTQPVTPAAPATGVQTTPPTADMPQQTVPSQAPTTATEGAMAVTPAATPTAATPATGPAQIAQVVNTEFASYDKDANGNLDKTEFGAWMVALKTASDPTTKAADPATQSWVGSAFASADKDKSSAVSKAELTSFLSQGAG